MGEGWCSISQQTPLFTGTDQCRVGEESVPRLGHLEGKGWGCYNGAVMVLTAEFLGLSVPPTQEWLHCPPHCWPPRLPSDLSPGV